MIYGKTTSIQKNCIDRRNGKKQSFKQYLIDEISKLFEVHSPEQICKILFGIIS
jgi:hypothetical protein